MGSKRISKRVREEAALICQVAASNDVMDYVCIGYDLGFALAAADLAVPAYYAAYERDRMASVPHIHAEAECLLRTGWTP